MRSDIPPFPLCWPQGIPRTTRLQTSQFRTPLGGAIKNVEKSLSMFGSDSDKPVSAVVVTSNVNGLTTRAPDDVGVAIWFDWAGGRRCIAVDRYKKVADNLQAIHHVIEADRVKLRHAGIEMVKASYRAYRDRGWNPDAGPSFTGSR